MVSIKLRNKYWNYKSFKSLTLLPPGSIFKSAMVRERDTEAMRALGDGLSDIGRFKRGNVPLLYCFSSVLVLIMKKRDD